ncbi:glycosyltransferase family 4 protein [Vibrio lentus]|uniref:Glycosyl transferase family 1 domain-containing protein n=1 Tax=Vibrio lentus TaxID=136468 RepID=A0A855IQ26_9VIBR|nr:glycosyltransferase family 1 protein [Vibrio lentus]PMJ65784.1 hypothetical protein BCU18_12600 [Vibrio lentus]PMJ79396.1 hypothetical protein BCU14_21330 [Vibrio lentus]PMM56272.1 hypothetical protein BCT51_23085 [Vibrio lentus]PMM57995.1 hypothetical protein BCT50_22835 [Vibrio lentus]PMN41962.1 hypothetical protein BCT33_00420 [Vibrio lentus]
MKQLKIGIDASRNRSGGARAHIIGVLNEVEPFLNQVAEVHIWTFPELAESLPEKSWLIIHTPSLLNKKLLHSLAWQKWLLPKELKNNNVDILLSTDAGSVCRFQPSVVMSRDMLSFEKGEMGRYFPSLSWLRLWALKHVQVSSLKSAQGAIFLTKYARDIISGYSGKINDSEVVPHGISEHFRKRYTGCDKLNEIKFIYVSNADKYKHQWHVIDAFYRFKKNTEARVSLTLVGADTGPCVERVKEALRVHDDGSGAVKVMPFLPHAQIPELLHQHDVFIFASSCENMPNTLIEAMASSLPIICSNRGPMPEVLTGKGIYFDPENPESIAEALQAISASESTLAQQAQLSYDLASRYSWQRCAKETMNYLVQVYKKSKK